MDPALRALAGVVGPGGISLEAARYTPRSIPGKATSPQYRNESCNGIRIKIDDPLQVRPFRLATALIIAIRRRHPDRLQLTKGLDTLAGGPEFRQQIEANLSAADIIASHGPALDKFSKERPLRYGLPPEPRTH